MVGKVNSRFLLFVLSIHNGREKSYNLHMDTPFFGLPTASLDILLPAASCDNTRGLLELLLGLFLKKFFLPGIAL